MNKLFASFLGLSVACAFASAQGVSFDARFGSRMGVNTHGTTFPTEQYDLIKNAGINWVRRDLNWSVVEPIAGVWDWTAYDKIVADAMARGIRLNLILGYGNRVYGENSPATALDRARYLDYVRRSVERYKGKGIVWEIWNEPNEVGFWSPEPNLDQYYLLADATASWMESNHPQEFVCLGGTSGIDYNWLLPLFQRGILSKVDAVAVHPYRAENPETALPDYTKLRYVIDKYKPLSRPVEIINSEWGYPLGVWNLDEYKQQTYTARTYFTAQIARIALNMYFSWTDLESHHGDNVGTMGLTTITGDLKPTYLAQKFYSQQLTGFRFVTRLRTSNIGDFLLLYTDGTQHKLVAYTSDNKARLMNLSLNAGQVEVADVFGGLKPYTFGSMGTFINVNGYPAVVNLKTRMPVLDYAAMTGGLPVNAMVKGKEDATSLLAPLFYTVKSPRFASDVTVQMIDESTGVSAYPKVVKYITKDQIPALGSRGAIASLFQDMPFVKDPSPSPRKLTIIVSMGINGKFTQEVLVYKPSFVQ